MAPRKSHVGMRSPPSPQIMTVIAAFPARGRHACEEKQHKQRNLELGKGEKAVEANPLGVVWLSLRVCALSGESITF